jgi:hypothetical protein
MLKLILPSRLDGDVGNKLHMDKGTGPLSQRKRKQ